MIPSSLLFQVQAAELRSMLRGMRRLFLFAALVSSACGGSPAAPAVAPVTVSSLIVAGNTTFTDAGQQAQLSATITLSNGTPQDQTLAAQWSSSDVAVATVSSSGLVTAARSGAATITAAFQGVTGTKVANVTISCQVNNTATVTIGNRSASASHDVIWDGIGLGTLGPGQNSNPIVAAAGVPHTLSARIANTSRLACATSTPILAQCSTPVITCSGE